MKAGIVPNKGKNTVLNCFRELIPDSRRIKIASAYIDKFAADVLSGLISNAIRKHPSTQVEILLRMSREPFNKPDAYGQYLILQNKYPKNIEVRISSVSCFHEKFYFFGELSRLP